MDAPDPADPASISGRENPRSTRHFWRWGIWFWILLWIVAMLMEVGLRVGLKDRPGMMLGLGYGSLVVTLDYQDVREVNDIQRHGPFFIWSERTQRLDSEYPEFLFARLGSMMWKTSGDRQTVALPVSCGCGSSADGWRITEKTSGWISKASASWDGPPR